MCLLWLSLKMEVKMFFFICRIQAKYKYSGFEESIFLCTVNLSKGRNTWQLKHMVLAILNKMSVYCLCNFLESAFAKTCWKVVLTANQTALDRNDEFWFPQFSSCLFSCCLE